MYRLPSLPPALQALAPLRVGAAARLTHGGAGLHQPPELWVQATREEVEVRCAGQAAPGWPDHLAVGPFLVRPLAGVAPAQALAERAVPLDAFALAADDAPLDPLGGLADLAAGRLRLPEPAALEADPSLLVHLPALASELGIELPEDLAALLAEQAGLVLRADRHRLREAMTRLLVSRRPQAGLELLQRLGVLTLVLPEVVALIDFHRSSRHHHKDVWQHTLQVVGQAVPRPSVRWAALLHDIGKTYTRSYTPDRKVHFLLHDELGAVMCEGITARLRFPPVLAARVERLVRFHLRANVYDPNWSDAAVRRFALELGEELEELLLLSRADVTSKRPGRRRQAMYLLHGLQARVASLAAAEAARRPVVPKGLGQAIITGLKVAAGPEIGRLRRLCEDAVRAGRLPADPSVEVCLEFLRGTRDAGGQMGDSTPRSRSSAA